MSDLDLSGPASDAADLEPRRLPLPWEILGLAVWIGLLVGPAELAILTLREALGFQITTDLHRLNRHASWMIPASNVAVFLVLGWLWMLPAWRLPRLTRNVAGAMLGCLAFWAILWRLPGLQSIARFLLAAGLGYQTARLARRFRPQFSKMVVWTLPVLVAATIFAGPIAHDRALRYETRAFSALPTPDPGAPNVVMLVLDTVRADHLTMHGYSRDTAPNLAKLAERGVRFDQARSTAPWTLPSHASMLTGRWPHELGTDAEHGMNQKYPTLAETLSTQGYATAAFLANTYYCNNAYGLDRGFVRWEDCYENDRVTAVEMMQSSALGRTVIQFAADRGWCLPPEAAQDKPGEFINRDALAWIDGHRDRPFFALLNYFDAHDPYLIPPGDTPRFGLRPDSPEDVATVRQWHSSDKRNLTDHQIDLIRDGYDDCIAYVDAQVGRLMADLERRGLTRDTIFVVTSDHGEQLGEHKLFGHGRSLYVQELHVPLIIAGAKIPAGQVVSDPVSLRSLPATIMDLMAKDNPFPGGSLTSAWTGGLPSSQPLLSEVRHKPKTSKTKNRPPAWLGAMASVRVGRMIYIRNADGREELFDIQTDPTEAQDLAANPHFKSSLAACRKALDRIYDDAPPMDANPTLADGDESL